MINAETSWKKIDALLEETLSSAIYGAWISSLRCLKYDEAVGILYLGVPNAAQKDLIEDRYLEIIKETSTPFFEKLEKIKFLIPEEENALMLSNTNESLKDDSFSRDVMLNPRYTFETFIEGDNNRFAYKAALAISESADRPNASYNPLFIYGGSGLGKTHLLNAIGHFIMDHFPKMRVLFVSSEMFMNDYINATRKKNMEHFEAKYRRVDVLMIDDVQFISEKEKTIEEVFNIYNFLYSRRKQLVFSSDRPPKDLLGLDERLISRLSSGLIVDLQLPALEVKVAILQNKAALDGIPPTEGLFKVIDIIAKRIKTNIREMEGAFNRVVTFSVFLGEELNENLAKRILSEMFTLQEDQITPDIIKKNVAKYYNIKVSDLESQTRKREFSFPRQIAMFLCREMMDISLPKIGDFFGKRDHTTVLHAFEKIDGLRKKDPAFEGIIKEIEKNIKSSL
jgi:chromosomal replication initiator protein